MFVHLHGHSTFSFLEAIGKPAKIAARAKELGMPAIAITDYNGMFGSIKLLQAAKEEGITPIFGVELGFVLDVNSQYPVDHIGNLVFLAKTTEGYGSLMELTSFANTLGVKQKPKVDLSAIRQFSSGVIAFFGGTQSWIGKMILRDESREKIVEIIGLLQSLLGKEHIYGEIIAQSHNGNPDLERVNTYVYSLCEDLGIPCLVNSNYHYVKKSDKDAWEVALAVKDAKKIYDLDRRKPLGDYHIMSEDEVKEILIPHGYTLDQIQSLIDTNMALVSGLDVHIKLGQVLFPNYESPQDIKEVYTSIKDNLVEHV